MAELPLTPFRVRVLMGLTAALEEINPAGGYRYDLSGAVFRGREKYDEDDPLPMVSILEAVEQADDVPPPIPSKIIKSPWELLVQGFVSADTDNMSTHPTDPAHCLMADVKRRLIQEKAKASAGDGNLFGLGPKGSTVTELRMSNGVVRPADEVSATAYFWLRLTLTLVENLDDPYS